MSRRRAWLWSGGTTRAGLPVGKLATFGIWESERFVGVVVFSWGANMHLSKPYGLDMTECVELVRVAMRDHDAPVSQVVAEALRILKRTSPGVRLVVSFADPSHGHHGGIYQAGNWVYAGRTAPVKSLVGADGVVLNRRAYTGHNYGQPKMPIPAGARWVEVPGKHRYLMPLDRKMRRAIASLAQPYPEKNTRGGSVEGDTPSPRDGKAGSIPAHRSTVEEPQDASPAGPTTEADRAEASDRQPGEASAAERSGRRSAAAAGAA